MRGDDVQCGGVRSQHKSFHVFSVVVLGRSVKAAIYVSVWYIFVTITLEYSHLYYNTQYILTGRGLYRYRSLRPSEGGS